MAVKKTTFGKRGVNKAIRQAREQKAIETNLTKTQKYDAIHRPIITEKSMEAVDQRKYTFAVDKNITKPNIKAAIEEIYGVEIESISTANVKRKPKTVGRYSGFRSGYKKAIVKLSKESKTIESFDM